MAPNMQRSNRRRDNNRLQLPSSSSPLSSSLLADSPRIHYDIDEEFPLVYPCIFCDRVLSCKNDYVNHLNDHARETFLSVGESVADTGLFGQDLTISNVPSNCGSLPLLHQNVASSLFPHEEHAKSFGKMPYISLNNQNVATQFGTTCFSNVVGDFTNFGRSFSAKKHDQQQADGAINTSQQSASQFTLMDRSLREQQNVFQNASSVWPQAPTMVMNKNASTSQGSIPQEAARMQHMRVLDAPFSLQQTQTLNGRQLQQGFLQTDSTIRNEQPFPQLNLHPATQSYAMRMPFDSIPVSPPCATRSVAGYTDWNLQQPVSPFNGFRFSQQPNLLSNANFSATLAPMAIDHFSIPFSVPPEAARMQQGRVINVHNGEGFNQQTQTLQRTFPQFNLSIMNENLQQFPESNLCPASQPDASSSVIQPLTQFNSHSATLPYAARSVLHPFLRSNLTSASPPYATRSTVLPCPRFQSGSLNGRLDINVHGDRLYCEEADRLNDSMSYLKFDT